MTILHDDEFGEIEVKTRRNSSRISIKISTDGRLQIITPYKTPKLAIKALLKTSRASIRKLVVGRANEYGYIKDQIVGKSHFLIIERSENYHVQTTGTKIIASLPNTHPLGAPEVQQDIRQEVAKALRKEAKSYLPRRLHYLAKTHGFEYKSTRLTHAGSRWGSCSSNGTISMNIALMKLPFELIDYVLIHELCHTRHMNHSKEFWSEVARYDSEFLKNRKKLKNYSPNI